jgi:transposase
MYRQTTLFTLDQILEIQPLTKLQAVLTFVDYSIMLEAFKIDASKRGPKGFSYSSLLNALLAMQIEQLPTVKALVKRLKTDPVLRVTCGFDAVGKTPSAATFSRFIEKLSKTNVLEKTFHRMVRRAKTLGLIDGTHVSIDASKIDAFEHAIPKSRIPENNPEFPHWGAKQDTNGNMIKWFGWKMHAVVDTTSGIPLGYIITPANIADMVMAIPLMNKLKEDYENLFKPSYYIMDTGYDTPAIYQHAILLGAQAIISINWRNTKIPPEGINWEGQLVCTMNFPYVNGGNDNGTIRLLCPHTCGKANCPMGSNWCTTAKSGYVGKVKIKDNPRFISYPLRGTEAWDNLYDERTSVERFFGNGKENYALNNLRVAGLKKAKVFVDLTCIAIIAARIAKAEQSKNIAA